MLSSITPSASIPAPTTLAAIGTAAAAGMGARRYITDSTAVLSITTVGVAVVGGGTIPCPVVSNGTIWQIG